MGRIRQVIMVNGRECWTLFDTGARNTYVVHSVSSLLITSKTQKPFRSAIGGQVKETTETALLEAEIDGEYPRTRWLSMILEMMKMELPLKFFLVHWRCNNGASG